jgi:hypothetical protein
LERLALPVWQSYLRQLAPRSHEAVTAVEVFTVAVAEVFTAAAHTSRAAVLEVVDFMAVAAGSASDLELRLA